MALELDNVIAQIGEALSSLPEKHGERIRWLSGPEHRNTLRFYASYLGGPAASQTVLDLGAGPGTVAIPLSHMPSVGKVMCLDVDQAALATVLAMQDQGIAGCPIQTTDSGNPDELPFESDSFDGVICRYAMHHFANRSAVMREVARCLKPGGVFLYSDPVMPAHARDTTHGLYLVRERSFHGYITYHETMAMIADAGLSLLGIRPYAYQRGTLRDFLMEADAPVREHLIRAWRGLDQQTKAELGWSGDADGPFIVYPVIDLAAQHGPILVLP